MEGCLLVDTHIEESLKLYIEPNQVPINKGRCQRLVGRLMYLAYTRPDLTYALSAISQYMHNLGEQHMNAVVCILKHLKSTLGKGILFIEHANYQSVDAYTNAD